jgi:meso-butanediol dehydrogenase/(S,S)-butanediol dehydrogenase/diacetyl reductase
MGLMIVSGSQSGIGLAAVKRLRSAGHEVVGWDVADKDEPVDVGDDSSIEAAVERLDAKPDGVVLAAGTSSMAPLTETTTAQWEHQIRVNAFGVFASLRALLPQMESGGSVVVISSVAGLRGAPLLSAYSASKFATIGLVHSAAVEQGARGVRVNAVCPMYVRTPMQERELGWEGELRDLSPDEVLAGYEERTPLGRVASAEEIADVVAFLLGPDSSYMTGSVVTVTGGADVP